MHLLYLTKLSRKSQDFYFLVGIHLNPSPAVNIDVYNNVRIRAFVWARACVNSVCMKGMLVDSHRSDLAIGGTETHCRLLVVAKIWSGDSYEKNDPNVDNLVLVLPHTWWCCPFRTVSTLNDKLGNHHVIIGAPSFLNWWGATEAAFSVGSVIPKISCCHMNGGLMLP